MATSYDFQRGETIRVMLEAVDATEEELDAVVSVTAALKAGRTPPPDSVPVAATFSVDRVPAQGGLGPGWVLTISAADSAKLAPGPYVSNAVLTFSGGVVEKTEPLPITIKQAT